MRTCCALLSIPLFPAITRSKILLFNNNSIFQSKIYCLNSLGLSKRQLLSHLNENGATISGRHSSISSNCSVPEPSDDFVVVNFYRFVFIEDPHQEVANHLSFVKDLDIHGRIYMNEQGINAQFSGPPKDALAYVDWIREDFRFSDILVQVSPAVNGHAFPKLKLRYKPSLVQLEGGVSHLPLLDHSMRATPLTPFEWRKKVEAAKEINRNSTLGSNYVLLDVRNGYEWDIGHFVGAQRPDTDCFRSTSFGLSHREFFFK